MAEIRASAPNAVSAMTTRGQSGLALMGQGRWDPMSQRRRLLVSMTDRRTTATGAGSATGVLLSGRAVWLDVSVARGSARPGRLGAGHRASDDAVLEVRREGQYVDDDPLQERSRWPYVSRVHRAASQRRGPGRTRSWVGTHSTPRLADVVHALVIGDLASSPGWRRVVALDGSCQGP